MSKHSKTMPKGEAKPLGTPRAKSSKKLRVAVSPLTPVQLEKIASDMQNVLDAGPLVDVDSLQMNSAAAMTSLSSPNSEQENTHMATITLTKDTKARKTSSIVYTSPELRGGVRLVKTAFANGTPDDTIQLTGNFAAPKPVETKEERKARLKAMPKMTLAEKIAKREASLNALKAKAAAAVPAEPATV